MNYGFDIDPRDVLGVSREATLSEIHEAFRSKSKKHHPDVGGDEWAFRIVSKSYEILSSQRVLHRAVIEEESATVRRTKTANGAESKTKPKGHGDIAGEWVRAGVEDAHIAPSRIVDVELFTLRYELDSPLAFLESPESRNLSCCLTATWPDPELAELDLSSSDAVATLKLLVKVFSSMPRKTRALSNWSRTSDGRFVGWMNYPTAIQAYQGFEAFRSALLARGLGARQRTRELFLSRDQIA